MQPIAEATLVCVHFFFFFRFRARGHVKVLKGKMKVTTLFIRN